MLAARNLFYRRVKARAWCNETRGGGRILGRGCETESKPGPTLGTPQHRKVGPRGPEEKRTHHRRLISLSKRWTYARTWLRDRVEPRPTLGTPQHRKVGPRGPEENGRTTVGRSHFRNGGDTLGRETESNRDPRWAPHNIVRWDPGDRKRRTHHRRAASPSPQITPNPPSTRRTTQFPQITDLGKLGGPPSGGGETHGTLFGKIMDFGKFGGSLL